MKVPPAGVPLPLSGVDRSRVPVEAAPAFLASRLTLPPVADLDHSIEVEVALRPNLSRTRCDRVRWDQRLVASLRANNHPAGFWPVD